ncbi:MAG: T9SS type A sorting domain-containing protein [Bacteroidota bacterium]|nr:T9SS type A sorting domain-containing protein [Bacteroidota bacterium]
MKKDKSENTVQFSGALSKRWKMIFGITAITFSLSVQAQSMLVESLNGPVTQAEIDAFKTYMLKKVSAPAYNGSNIWVYGNSGKAIEACGLMYEASKDTAILDRMIYYCDAALAGRNDLASAAIGGQLATWTGNIDPVWPSSDATTIPAGAGVEQGQVLSHIAYCAKLILETPAIWDVNVAIGDPKGFGTMYKARALKYIKECDYVMDNWILPRFIRSTESNHYYFPGSPNTYKPGEPAPWNQAWMLTNGFVRLVLCHMILGDDPARVTKYDGIVKPNIDWFFASLHANTSSIGTDCWTWAYALPTGMEDTNHAAYDSEGLWVAYNSGRYGLNFSDMVPFANTYFDVVLATVTNGLFAGRVDGTTGTGHAGGDNYVRDEYIYLTEFRPEKYNTVGNIEISTNKVSSSPQITGRLLWEKYRRWPNVPASPTNLSATTVSNGGVDLTWTDNSANETSFNIERSSDAINWVIIKSVAANISGYSDTGLPMSSNYYYRVAALNNYGCSVYSNIVNVKNTNTSVNEIKSGYRLRVFPNPACDRAKVSYSLQYPGVVKLSLFNMNGNEVKVLTNSFKQAGSHESEINTSNLNSGVYIVRLTCMNSVTSVSLQLFK